VRLRGRGSTWVAFPSGDEPGPIRVVLPPARRIAGRVLHADGRPAAEATVIVTDGASPERFGPRPPDEEERRTLGSVRTAADGTFEVPDLPEGPYRVSVSGGRRFTPRTSTPARLTTSLSGVASDVRDLVLMLPRDDSPPVQPLEGTVVDARTGKQVVTFSYTLRNGDLSLSGQPTSLGRFRAERVPVGVWTLEVFANGYLSAKLPEIEVRADAPPAPVVARLESGVIVKGTFQEAAGSALGGCEARFTPVPLTTSSVWGAGVPLGPDGSFQLGGFRPGRYRAIVYHKHGQAEPPPFTTSEADPLVVPDGAPEVRYDVTIEQGAILSVLLNQEDRRLAARQGEPTEQQRAYSEGSSVEIRTARGEVWVREESLRIPLKFASWCALPPGVYNVRLAGAPEKAQGALDRLATAGPERHDVLPWLRELYGREFPLEADELRKLLDDGRLDAALDALTDRRPKGPALDAAARHAGLKEHCAKNQDQPRALARKGIMAQRWVFSGKQPKDNQAFWRELSVSAWAQANGKDKPPTALGLGDQMVSTAMVSAWIDRQLARGFLMEDLARGKRPDLARLPKAVAQAREALTKELASKYGSCRRAHEAGYHPPAMKRPVAARAERFTESVIREMTRLAQHHRAVNLAQGFPDFPAPDEVKRAAAEAIAADVNQYAITWGSRPLREAIARRLQHHNGIACDPETEITVCCGATEAMVATLLAIADPGDEIVILEPFYENYGPDCILSGAVPRFVPLRPPEWTFDRDELTCAFSDRTKAIVLNTPHNPTGHVFTRDELGFVAGLCARHDALAVTDEIYEYILYGGRRHVSLATLPGMRERTVTISGMSKTFSVTGWRVGWAVAPPRITAAIRKVHDFLTVGAPAPLQQAGAAALALPDSFFDGLRGAYERRRDLLLPILERAGFGFTRPEGAYYVMTDLGRSGFLDDVAFARHLVSEVGVAVVPGSSFYSDPARGARQVRFCFPKRDETLQAAGERLETRLRAR